MNRDPDELKLDCEPERDVDEEFAFHIEMRTRELVAQGCALEAARRQAVEEFGDVTRHRAECVEIQRSIRTHQTARRFFRDAAADIRAAARALRRRPAFAALAVTTLGLGIGAVTAIFTLVDATLLRPLPYPDSEQLVTVWETSPAQPRRSVAPANYVDFAERSRSIQDWTAWRVLDRTLSTSESARRVTTASVTARFFTTLGVDLHLGAGLDASGSSGAPSAVLGYGLWQRAFGGDPTVIGRTVLLDDAPYTVVGVAADGLAYPRRAELWSWVPVDLPEAPGFPGDPMELRDLRDARFIQVLGRLAPNANPESARAEMDRLMADLRAEHPEANRDAGVRVIGLQDHLVSGFSSTVLLLLAAVGLVMLIACANVANLLLVRAIERRRELAVRQALGASSGRLLGHHLGEGLVLAASGAGLGVAIGYGLVRVAERWSWAWGDTALALDLRVVAMVVGLVGLTALAFGALPTFIVRAAPGSALGGRGGEGGGDRATRRVRTAFLTSQVALAVALVLSTGLTVRTVLALRAVELGFVTDRLATLQAFLDAELDDPAARAVAMGTLAGSLAEDPAVASVAVASSGPLDLGPVAGLRVENLEFAPGEEPDVGWQFVSPSYFETLGIPMLRGRAFSEADVADTPPVGIVNATLARHVFGDANPIGRRVNTGLDGQGTWVEVVGVAADTRNRGPAEQPAPMLHRPLSQAAGRSALLMARMRVEPEAVALARLQEGIRDLVPGSPVSDARTGQDLAASFTRSAQLTLGVLGGLAGVAILLAVIGLYAVTSYAVTRQTRDLGVRLALGASPASIVWRVVRASLRPAVVGVALGIGGAALLASTFRSLLHEVTPYDPVTLFTVAVGALAVMAAASLAPAIRAARLDPVTTLRE